jgi:hypothetical protein
MHIGDLFWSWEFTNYTYNENVIWFWEFKNIHNEHLF